MTYDSNNVFARILRHELPCVVVHEDDFTLSFMDRMPQADGHVLVIPKEPAATLLELSEEAGVACIRVVHRMVLAAKMAMNSDGVLVMQTNGAASGQTVPHVHFHVIPRYHGKAMHLHAAKIEVDDKLRELAGQIRRALT